MNFIMIGTFLYFGLLVVNAATETDCPSALKAQTAGRTTLKPVEPSHDSSGGTQAAAKDAGSENARRTGEPEWEQRDTGGSDSNDDLFLK